MQIKLLKEIVSSIVGQSAAKIVDLLYDKKNVNEFLIAKKLGLTINQTRNVLYKLADEGLVSFIRKKDSKKGGWYTYFWTLSSGKSLEKFKEHLNKQMEDINSRIGLKKTGRFFFCKNCQLEYNEESALLNNYTCPECGEPLELKNNTSEISELEKENEKLRAVMVDVQKELDVIGVADQKVKARKIKAEQKKKEKEKLERKKEREKARKLEKGKTEKKSKKKK